MLREKGGVGGNVGGDEGGVNDGTGSRGAMEKNVKF